MLFGVLEKSIVCHQPDLVKTPSKAQFTVVFTVGTVEGRA